MNNPLVSVMITSYNQKDILPRAIDSVLSQTYKNLQIVIADDGSTDASQDLINQYYQRFPDQIKPILSPKNQGIPKNKNMGFRACDGDFITYLDGDDFYYPEKIEREIKVFKLEPSFGVVFSNFAFVNQNCSTSKYWKREDIFVPQGDIFIDVFSRNFPFWTLYRNELIRKELLEKINYYDENLIAYEDWDSRIRLSKIAKIGYSDYVGAAYVDDPKGISKTEKRQRLLQEMRYVMTKNSRLLNDLKLFEKIKVLRTLEIAILEREISCSPSLEKLFLTFKYVAITGNLKFFLNLIKQKIKSIMD